MVRPDGRFITRWTLAIAAAMVLLACGGGQGSTGEARRFAAQIAAQTGTTTTAAAPADAGGRTTRLSAAPGATPTPDPWFSWAERQYPALFPPGRPTETATHDGVTYTVRHYPATGNYLGVVADGRVYSLGDFTGQRVQAFGHLSYYACLIDPAACGPLPAWRQVSVSAGTVQCGETSIRQPLQAMRQRLIDAGVHVQGATCGHALGYGTCSACGCSDLRILIFDVPADQTPLAFGETLAPYTEGVDGVAGTPSRSCDY